jgi:hypothetical protein
MIDQENIYKISFHGIASKVGFHISHERITSSCDLHHDLETYKVGQEKERRLDSSWSTHEAQRMYHMRLSDMWWYDKLCQL